MELKEVIGVIFDFNGTMFFDSQKHNKAWITFLSELSGLDITDEDSNRYITGKNPKQMIENVLGYEVSDEMIEQFCEEKEGIYRRLCNEDKENLKLAPGLEKFLDFLTEHNIPITIASTATLSNINYYFEVFDLYRWFDPEKIVYHDVRIKDKPAPDMYLVACKLIDKEPARVLVFEDSSTGIQAAEAAGVKNIVVIKGDNEDVNTEGYKYITAVINDFTELNKALEFEYA